MAIVQFTSPQNYQVAEVGNSDNLIEGQNIFFAGYPGELRTESDRFYRFLTANIVSLRTTTDAKGYSLIYDGPAFPGMSGGPVLNDQGLLIGIHGSANIHSVTGAVSNYAIPINTYQEAIASLNNNESETANSSSENVNNDDTPDDPDISVETKPTQEQSTEATKPETEIVESEDSNNDVTAENSATVIEKSENNNASDLVPEAIVETTDNQQQTAQINSSNTNSVPAFSSPQNSEQSSKVTTSNDQTESRQETSSGEIAEGEVVRNRKISLISEKTGIDYRNLRNLLAQEKWREADRQTKKSISNIFQTVKRQHNSNTIELRTLADRSCSDLITIDVLWRKYSGDRFGLRLQQNIWNNLNQNNNFSINVWRSFATEIGWKTGDINNATGYILYENLDFNPQTASQGHLPWWFDYSDEQKNVMRQVLTRCNF